MTEKPFLSIDEQVTLLESRGMTVGSQDSLLLRREGYYQVINGYKTPFLQADDRPTLMLDDRETFAPGTRLAHLGYLLEYDRRLRGVLSVGLGECEALLREATARNFCAVHSGAFDYLDLQHYSDGSDRRWLVGEKLRRYLAGRDRLITDTLRRVGRPATERETLRRDYRPLDHYRSRHGDVPLWIAAMALTFGEVCTLYSTQMLDTRRAIASDLREMYVRSWGVKSEAFGERAVDNSYSFLRKLRNVCAHDERCYNVRLHARGEIGVSEAIGRMRLFMRKETFRSMLGELDAQANWLRARVSAPVCEHVLTQVLPRER